MLLGSCRTSRHPDMWFPDRHGSPKAAQRICGECPVAMECLSYGLLRNEAHGVWGGKTPGQLEEMRDRLGILDR